MTAPMRYALELDRGRPLLRADGRRLPALLYSTGHPRPRHFRRFRELGVELFSFPATADFHLYGLAEPCWIGPEEWDYEPLDRLLRTILDAVPDALLLPRVFTCSPPWWDALHPEDLARFEGDAGGGLLHGALKHQVPGPASRAWAEARRENLRRFVRHVEEGPFAASVAGYLVTSGTSEEWFHWGTQEGHLFDYGPETERAFQAWLARRRGDDRASAEAPGRTQPPCEVRIPDARRRRPPGGLSFFDPTRDRDVVDFHRFLADLAADAISDVAAVVKRESGGRKLFGTFYGYLMELAWHPDGLQTGGHMGLPRILADDNVDFLASPGSYGRRFAAEGFSMPMVPSGSLELAGKVFFHENDVRTHLLEDDAGYGRTENRFETASIQRREFASAATRGQGMWWFDMTGGWYEDPAARGAIRRIVEIQRLVQDSPRESVEEIALVLDPESLLHCRAPENQLVHLQCMQALQLSRAGAPFEVYLLDDLEHLQRQRFFVFPNLFLADEARVRRVHGHLAANRATALFLVAPGLAGGIEGARRLTGMNVRLLDHPRLLRVHAASGERFGAADWWWPGLVIDDPGAEILGHYEEGGEPALARKAHEGFVSVVSAAPSLPGSLLRRLAAAAGVHIFSETDDAVYACNDLLALHARSTGLKTLSLPGPETLFDLVNEVEIPARDGRSRFYLPRGETALFQRRPSPAGQEG